MSKERIPSGSWLRKPTNAQVPSRRWTSGAANSFGSSSNGRADATSHGPSGESPRTYQVLKSIGSRCSSGWQVKTSSHWPSTHRTCMTSSCPNCAGSVSGGASRHSTMSSLRACATTPSARRSRVGSRAVM